MAELHAGYGPTFLIGPRAVRAEYSSLWAPRTEILAGLPALITETIFLIVTRYQLRNIYVNGTLLVFTYLYLQKLIPIKGFPKCLSIVTNLQRGPKIFMRASCGPRLQISARVRLWSMAMTLKWVEREILRGSTRNVPLPWISSNTSLKVFFFG